MTELASDEWLLMIRFAALGGASGISTTRMIGHRLRLHGGNIDFKIYRDAEMALEAAGLSE